MKFKEDHFLTQKFYHLEVMVGRHITIRKCTLLLIYTLILVSVFIIRDKYGPDCYRESQQTTEGGYHSEKMYSKSVQSELEVVTDIQTTAIRTQLVAADVIDPSVQTHGQNAVTKNHLRTLSSDGRRIQALSSDRRSIQSARNKTVITTTPRLSYKKVEEILDRVQDWFLIKNEPEKDRLLNRHQFTFHLNSRLCANHFDILIFVHSASQNIKRRDEIRKTWGSVKQYRNVSIVTVFMLGESNNSFVNHNLTVESVTYGDTVQGNFLDSYRNLTYKHVMALHWITSQCNDVRTIVKVDDDVLIDIYKLINFSISTGHVHNKLYCSYFFRGNPIRDVRDKWYTPQEVYPFEMYPTYCEGLAYILSADELAKLYKASEDTRFYWVDDVYVTGILARKAGMGHLHFAPKHSYMKKNRISNTVLKDAMFYLDYDDWSDIWSRIHTERNIYE